MFEILSVVVGLGTVVFSFVFNVWLLNVTLPFIVGGAYRMPLISISAANESGWTGSNETKWILKV